MTTNIELAIVMPVYNEQGAIGNVVKKWHEELSKHKIKFELHTYNDGSKDNTKQILDELAKQYHTLRVHHKTNSGHGPTILLGYRENSHIPWVFQTDSDDELPPDSFILLWDKRNDYDFLIGSRCERNQPKPRKIISAISRSTVRLFYKKGVHDVNSPYRLMRTERLKTLFQLIPENTFAPNVIISGMAGLRKLRIFQIEVPHQNRKTGEVSIKKWKLFKVSLRSFRQTIAFRFSKAAKNFK